MNKKDSVVKVENLTRNYIKKSGILKKKTSIVKAVDGISFEVKKGEIFGLLGQNGAGKTTTIKMLITLLAPTKGICKVLGCDTFKEDKLIRPRINFIFGGEMGVYRRLSARDNLRYFANLYLIPKEKQASIIDKLLTTVDLIDRADDLVETFSKGMIQRLQIARGLINNPEIVFMDEPTIGLDPIGAKMLRKIIMDLKEDGKTVILTTHNLVEAEELCDRIVIMNKGKIIKQGTPGEIKERYSSLEEAYIDSVKGVS